MLRLRKVLIVFMSLTLFASCAAPTRPEVKARNLWVGFWYISEAGFPQAVKSKLVVQLREDGEFFTGYHNGVQFTTTMASGKWNVIDDKFIDVRPEETLTSTYEVVSDQQIILSIGEDQKLYLVRREEQ